MAFAEDGRSGTAFLVSAGIVYEIIAAACSSPQTTEINASVRLATLMKWVHIGLAQAVGFILVAAYIDSEHRGEILAGGALGAALMYGSYIHAARSGVSNPGPPTEQYGP